MGTGITSIAAAQANATAPDSRSIGYAENALLPLGAYATFRGQPVDATSVLIAYTRSGDANLDGIVDDNDVTIVGATYAPGVAQPHWGLGDFDYNSFVDDDDVTLLGALYEPGAMPMTAAPHEGPADRNLVAPVAPTTRLWRAVMPGTVVPFNLERSEEPTRNRDRSVGPPDLRQQKAIIKPGPHGPGYSLAALRASQSEETRAQHAICAQHERQLLDLELLDLLAESMTTRRSRRVAFT
jgi:hypothetical protein